MCLWDFWSFLCKLKHGGPSPLEQPDLDRSLHYLKLFRQASRQMDGVSFLTE